MVQSVFAAGLLSRHEQQAHRVCRFYPILQQSTRGEDAGDDRLLVVLHAPAEDALAFPAQRERGGVPARPRPVLPSFAGRHDVRVAQHPRARAVSPAGQGNAEVGSASLGHAAVGRVVVLRRRQAVLGEVRLQQVCLFPFALSTVLRADCRGGGQACLKLHHFVHVPLEPLTQFVEIHTGLRTKASASSRHSTTKRRGQGRESRPGAAADWSQDQEGKKRRRSPCGGRPLPSALRLPDYGAVGTSRM